jgi:hypothetical protein
MRARRRDALLYTVRLAGERWRKKVSRYGRDPDITKITKYDMRRGGASLYTYFDYDGLNRLTTHGTKRNPLGIRMARPTELLSDTAAGPTGCGR